jgi:hypothetical protein
VDTRNTKETEMSTSATRSALSHGPTRPYSAPTWLFATIAGKWREYRALRDIESVPYSVMKDIGFRSTEQMNAK